MIRKSEQEAADSVERILAWTRNKTLEGAWGFSISQPLCCKESLVGQWRIEVDDEIHEAEIMLNDDQAILTSEVVCGTFVTVHSKGVVIFLPDNEDSYEMKGVYKDAKIEWRSGESWEQVYPFSTLRCIQNMSSLDHKRLPQRLLKSL